MTYYKDIFTMPVYNWFKVMAESNFGFLTIDSTNVSTKDVRHDN